MSERLDRVEADIVEIKRSISELHSTVTTLADTVEIHERLHKESRQRFDQMAERFDRFLEQANQDRALMLQLSQLLVYL